MSGENEAKTAEVIPMLQARDLKPGPISVVPHRNWSLVPQSFQEAQTLATIIANSDFAPKDYRGKPNNVLIAVQMGADLGLKPMQALQNIAVINGRPSVWGDAVVGIVQASGALERFFETFEGEGEKLTAICIVKRRGIPDEFRRTFSVADAKTAGLWGKQGPWQTYPKRMLQMRARGFALRDSMSDMLLGLVLAEEAMDYPAIDATGDVVQGEVVTVTHADKIPEDMRATVEKAFETLNMSAAQRLVKVNEFLGAEGVDSKTATKNLLQWCRDEYSLRTKGRPTLKTQQGNGKQAPSGAASSGAGSPGPSSAPAGGDQGGRPSGAETSSSPDSAGTPTPAAAANPFDQNEPRKGELF
jgi:hypothetical protein